MSIKSRLNKLEQGMKQKGQDPKEQWRQDMARKEEIQSLESSVHAGDLEACIRYVELSGQGVKWRNNAEGLFDTIYKYRDLYIKIASERVGVEPDYSKEDFTDVWYYNLKATIRYLEARREDPQAEKPVLKVYESPGE